MACAHVQPATVKAHAPALANRFPTSGFGRRPDGHRCDDEVQTNDVVPQRRGKYVDGSNAIKVIGVTQ